jgi:hypothetical protein
MINFIKQMLQLGAELDQTDSPMQASVIRNNAEVLYKNHQYELKLLNIDNVSKRFCYHCEEPVKVNKAGTWIICCECGYQEEPK